MSLHPYAWNLSRGRTGDWEQGKGSALQFDPVDWCVTSVGHVFAMYAAHQDGQGIRAVFSAPDVHYDRDGQPALFWGLRGSASLSARELTLTVVNPHVHEPRETRITLRGGRLRTLRNDGDQPGHPRPHQLRSARCSGTANEKFAGR